MSSTLCLASLPLFLSLAVAAPASIWRISILESPAPPPDEGPPLSATAIRDKSKLKYEIIGIFAAYVIWVLISLFLIFFVGKRLRRKAQTSNRTLSMEMLKTANAQAYPIPPGPKSPGKIASLKSWATGGKHNYKHSDVTVSSIDEKIIDSDKQRNMDQMTNIYAAVMAHDEERSQKTRNSNRTSPTSPRSPIHPENSTQAAQAMPTPPISPQYPPEFQHLRSAVAQAQTAHQALHHPMPPAPAEDHSTSTSRASTKKGTPLSFISGKHDKSGSSNSHQAQARAYLRSRYAYLTNRWAPRISHSLPNTQRTCHSLLASTTRVLHLRHPASRNPRPFHHKLTRSKAREGVHLPNCHLAGGQRPTPLPTHSHFEICMLVAKMDSVPLRPQKQRS